MGGELVWVAVQLAICVAFGAVVLRFVPPKASRTWANGLLIVAMLANLEPVIGVIVAQFERPSFYLETEKNRLEFNRGPGGEVFGVTVNNPPPECLTYLKGPGERTWVIALATITLTLVALVMWRRASREAPAPVGTADPGGTGVRAQSTAGM
jgi:hypothetical protein